MRGIPIIFVFSLVIAVTGSAQNQNRKSNITFKYVREHLNQNSGLFSVQCNAIVETDHQSFYVTTGSTLDILEGSGISRIEVTGDPGGNEFESLVYADKKLFAAALWHPAVYVLKNDFRKKINLDRDYFKAQVAMRRYGTRKNSIVITSNSWQQNFCYQWIQPQTLQFSKIYSIAKRLKILEVDSDSRLITIGSGGSGVFLVQNGKIMDSLYIGPNNRIITNCIVTPSNETLYITSLNGKLQKQVLISASKQEAVTFARFFPEEQLLVFKRGKSLFQVQDGKESFIDSFSPNINQAYIDRNKNLWLCTNRGLYNYYQRKINTVSFSGLNDDISQVDFIKKTDGMYLMPSSYNGFMISNNMKEFFFDKELTGLWKHKTVNAPALWAQNVVKYRSILACAIDTTLIIKDNEHIKTFDISHKEIRISNLAIDSVNNKIIFTGYKGLYSYNIDKRSIRQEAVLFEHDSLGYNFSLAVNNTGDIIVGSKRLYKVAGGKVSVLMDINKGKDYYHFCYDKNGLLWIGNCKQIWIYNNEGKARSVTNIVGNKNINGMTIYKNWLVIEMGNELFFLDKDKYLIRGTAVTHRVARNAGIKTFKGLINAMCADEQENSLYWACMDVLYRIEPDAIIKQSNVITTPYIKEIGFLKSGEDRVLVTDTSGTPTVIAPKEINNVFFKIGYSYYISNPLVRYRLKGVNKDWRYTRAPEISYHSLKPGKYQLEVQIGIISNQWSDAEFSKYIIILPLWYQTAWFKILAAILLMAICRYIYQFRKRQLEKVKVERERISRDMHDNIGAGISALKLQAEFLKQKLDNDPSISRDIEELLNTSEDMNFSMRELMWGLQSQGESVQTFTEKALQQAKNFLSKSQIHFEHTISIANEAALIAGPVRRELFFCLKEAINNIYKHSQAANVLISVLQAGNSLTIEVKDDGIGLSSIEQPGNGLRNMQQRMKNIGGVFEILPVSNGTHLRYTVPL